jgi:hypothetical protein
MLFVDIPAAGEYWAIIEDAEVQGARPPGAAERARGARDDQDTWRRAPTGLKQGFRAVHVRAASVAIVRRLEVEVGGEIAGGVPVGEGYPRNQEERGR